MSLSLSQTNTATICGVAAYCSGLAAATTAQSFLAKTSGTAGGAVTLTIAKSSTGEQRGLFLDCTIPPGMTWSGGTWTILVNVTTANANLTLSSCFVCRVNSGCANQSTVASGTSLGISCGSTGVKTITLNNGTLQTPASGDRIVIVVGFTNSTTSSATLGVTGNQTVTAPFVFNPFFATNREDYPAALGAKRTFRIPDDDYTQNLLLTAAVQPFYGSAANDIVTRRKSLITDDDYTQNVLPSSQTLGFPSGEYTVLPRRQFIVPDDQPNLLNTLFAPVVVPRTTAFANIRSRSFFSQPDAPNLLTNTLAPSQAGSPFVSNYYPVSVRRKFNPPRDPQNLLNTLLAPVVPPPYFPPDGTPRVFRALVVTPVKSRSYNAAFEFVAANLLVTTLASVAAPFIPQPADALEKKPAIIEQASPNLLLTTLAPVQAPFEPSDYPVLKTLRSTLLQDPSNLLLTAAVAPFTSPEHPVLPKRKFTIEEVQKNLLPISQTLGFQASDYSVPAKRRFYQPEVSSNLLLTAAVAPFPSGDWTTSFRRRLVQQFDNSFNLPIINPLTILPPGQSVYLDIPPYRRKAVYYPDNAFNIHIAPLVLPPGTQENAYQIPRRKTVYYPDNAFNLPVTNPLTILPPGKNENAYQIPRRKVVYYPDNAFNLAIINPLSILPPGKNVYFDIPTYRRKPTVGINPFNINVLTVTQNPFTSFEYGVPLKRRSFVYQEDAPNLLLTAAVRPFTPSEFQLQQKRRFVAHLDPANLLPVSQSLPFLSGDWTQTYKRKPVTVEDVQNLLPLTQPGAPFASGEWVVGYRQKFTAQIDVNNLLPLAVSLIPFVPVEQAFQPPKRSSVPYDVFTTFNLPTATFIQPFPVGSATEQFVFKPRSRVLPEVYINLLCSTLIPPVLVSDPAYTVSLHDINYSVTLDGVRYVAGAKPVNYTATANEVNYAAGLKPILYTVRGKVIR